jgi:glycosyltransferase involved in cell wall biosynthesis
MASVRKHMADTIRSSEHLQFAISGLSGDWAAIAALEAIEQKRRFAIHTDCVEFELIKKTSAGASLKQRLKIAVIAPLMKLYHRHIIRHASLGLWHGNDCYRAFSPWCSESHLVHDIHTKQSDLIGDGELATKLAEVESASVLRLIYAGRLHPMKAPLEWLGAVAVARDKGARFTATWFGEGPLLEQAKAERERLHLEGIVTFAGFVADRATLLHHVRSAHAVLFTHVTPESPRNLLEALVSGTPILGYDNPYAVDLIREQGGGALVPLHDMQALGELIAELASDRARMAHLIADAASNGRRFSDSAVFAERSALLQRFA